MTQEEKHLLLVELCTRLPYRPKGVKLSHLYDPENISIKDYDRGFVGTLNDEIPIEKIRLYLRPMSSMTEEEQEQLKKLICEHLNSSYSEDEWSAWLLYDKTGIKNGIGGETLYFYEIPFIYDWLNAHHFDYRGLIPIGLALEAPSNMYNIK